MNKNISKRQFCDINFRKLKNLFHSAHVVGVIFVLFDEMAKDFKNGKSIKIANLGEFVINEPTPRNHFHFTLQKVMFSPGNRVLKFFLSDTVKKYIMKHLNIDKIMKDG